MTARAWMDLGTKLFLATLDGLTDAELDRPTALPGWSRRHVVAHVHYNAEALRRLVHWAATGERTPPTTLDELEDHGRLPASPREKLLRTSPSP